MTVQAGQVLQRAEVIVGYETYLRLIPGYCRGKEVISSGMTQEVSRALAAIARAREGARVAVVSGGDPGVYGMAGLILELLGDDGWPDVEVVPGITAATAAASSLGAPLMNDFAVISLSDLLTPWETIIRRVTAAARADFVIVLYNPASKKRVAALAKTREVLLCCRAPTTPVGIVRNCKRGERETVIITDLQRMLDHEVDMLTTVIVGNSTTRVRGKRMITPRGYHT